MRKAPRTPQYRPKYASALTPRRIDVEQLREEEENREKAMQKMVVCSAKSQDLPSEQARLRLMPSQVEPENSTLRQIQNNFRLELQRSRSQSYIYQVTDNFTPPLFVQKSRLENSGILQSILDHNEVRQKTLARLTSEYADYLNNQKTKNTTRGVALGIQKRFQRKGK